MIRVYIFCFPFFLGLLCTAISITAIHAAYNDTFETFLKSFNIEISALPIYLLAVVLWHSVRKWKESGVLWIGRGVLSPFSTLVAKFTDKPI